MEEIKIENEPFEKQHEMNRKLMTEAGGETASDYESDPDDIDETVKENNFQRYPKSRTTKEGDMIGEYAYRRDRIFKYITVLDK